MRFFVLINYFICGENILLLMIVSKYIFYYIKKQLPKLMSSCNYKGYILQEPLYHMFDGRDAAKRRTFKRRMKEAWVRKKGYEMLKIPYIYRVYILKPIIIGFIPQWLYRIIR